MFPADDKKHAYIWFRGLDLNGFRDIKPFINKTAWVMPGHVGEEFHICVIEYVLS